MDSGFWVYLHEDTNDPWHGIGYSHGPYPASVAQAGGLVISGLSGDDTYSFCVTTTYAGTSG